MTSGQRRAHAFIWIVLGPLLLIVLGLIVALRPVAPLSLIDLPAQGTQP
jgi:hypothetical protein